MNTEDVRWAETEAIFHDALPLPEPERSALLTTRCAGDTTLVAELRSLLAACEAEEMHRICVGTESVEPGTAVGPYVIDTLIGRGGMGAVYRAHRSDGQFEQQVAIKVVDMPLASEFFRERFRAERQVLARLAHPYIARLLDGGVTEEGELYLVMELIDGVSITDFCRQRGLPIEDRVLLFLRVCEAVQYSHRNLIVHRDLKPENILVVEDSTPRLLDFGTAKMMQPLPLDTNDNATRPGMQTFTPRYASPEQVLGHPISIASDIYSLGVLLYVLLTDAQPYTLVEFSTDELVRVICGQQPQKPSTVSPAAAKLDADLDAILLMALRKEPTERYSTVEKFSADLQAWIEHRPVLARRGNVRYRAGRFIRRNTFALAGVAVLVITAAAGVAGIAWQAHIARSERTKAQIQAEDLRQLSVSLLTELDEAIKQLPGSTSAQKLLVTRVLEHLDRVYATSVLDKPTALNLADAYTRVGNLEGNPYDQNIGDAAGGLVSVTKAVHLTEYWEAAQPSDPETLHAFAYARQSQSEILFGMDRTAEAVAAMKMAASAYASLARRSDATPSNMSDASSAFGVLGDVLGKPGKGTMGDAVGALAAYRAAIDYQKKALELNPRWPRALRTLPVAMLKIGNMETATDPWEAIRQFQNCLVAMDHYPSEEKDSFTYKRTYSTILRRLAIAYTEVQQYDQAARVLGPARATAEEEFKADAQDMRSRTDLVAVLDCESLLYEARAEDRSNSKARTQNRRNAQMLLERMVAILQDITKRTPQDINNRNNLARAQVRLGTLQQGTPQSHQGAQLAAHGLSALKEFGEHEPSNYLDDLLVTSLLDVEPSSLREPELAVKYAQRAVIESPQRPEYWRNLAQAYRASGAPPAARRNAALRGLALLMPSRPGGSSSITRKQLEAEAR